MMNEKETVTLIRKQSLPFTVNYPYQLGNSGLSATYVWQGTKGEKLDEKEVPIAVYNWLKNYTTTFQEGMLIIKDTEEVDFDDSTKNKEISDKILTEEELKKLFQEGNHNTLKSALNNLIKDLEDETQIQAIKNYIYRSAMLIGIDSSAKRKVICKWYGVEYEDVKDLFEKEDE